MANNTASNHTEDLARVFLEKFEASRVLTKGVNTQLLTPRLTPDTGGVVSFKRPHDYNTIRTAGGDISSSTKSDIIAGKSTGTVQNYFTVATEWTDIEEALELDQLDQILAPMATRMVTDLELDLGTYMQKNVNLATGTPGTAITAWTDVAEAYAMLDSIGCPKDKAWNYVMNPFTATKLASVQTGLDADGKVNSAWESAKVTSNMAGMTVLSSNALSSYTSTDAADRVGALTGAPTATYVGAKATMPQTWAVGSFTGGSVIKAGDVVEVTGRNRLGLSTRQAFTDSAGAQVKFRAVVTADVTLSGAGAGNIVVAGAAINEANGQYNTVDSALASGDVVTVLGGASQVRQPALFFHPNAFGIGTVKLSKLYSTDTVATTEDGMSIRVSRYSDGDSNKQKVRFDLLPAFICYNPFLAGQSYGA